MYMWITHSGSLLICVVAMLDMSGCHVSLVCVLLESLTVRRWNGHLSGLCFFFSLFLLFLLSLSLSCNVCLAGFSLTRFTDCKCNVLVVDVCSSLFPFLPPLPPSRSPSQDQAAKEKAMAGLATMSSAQIVSASSLQNAGTHRMFGTPGIAGNAVPMHTMLSPSESP